MLLADKWRQQEKTNMEQIIPGNYNKQEKGAIERSLEMFGRILYN